MTTPNIIILCMLIAGATSLIAGFRMNKMSSFEDGSFVVQMFMILAGAVAIAAALIWKFVASVF